MLTLLYIFLSISCVKSLFVPAASSDLFHTKWNWYVNTSIGSIEASNPGVYIKFTVTSTSKLYVILDLPQRQDYFANIAFSVDNGPFSDYSMGNETRILIAEKLNLNQSHSVFLYYKNHNGFLDRWLGPSTNLRILGFEADEGAIFSRPNDLRRSTMLVYWDSIGEGANSVQLPGNNWNIQRNDVFTTFSFSVAEAVGAELSLVAWGGQGLSVGGSGNIPPLWDASGLSNMSAWSWHDVRIPRTFEECPDIILNGHGTNDGLGKRPVALVAPRVLGWLQAMRSACHKSIIFQVVPFGQFSEEAILKGFNQYKRYSKDNRAHLIQLGPGAAKGLDHIEPSFCSGDGIHPWGWRSSQLGAQIAVAMLPHLRF